MDRGKLKVVENQMIADQIYRMVLSGALVKTMKQPGQFLHVKCGDGIDPLLRRPISICDVDLAEETVTLIYRAEGRGTKLLSQKAAGEQVDILGPLGEGFPIAERKSGEKALLIGGGVGVPPLYYLAKELAKRGVEIYAVLGFGTASQVFLAEEFARLGETRLTTMDGSKGTKGLVTDLLDQGYANGWNVLYSCGPLPMLKAIQERYGESGREAYLSIEQRMGCGVGACLACVVKPHPDHCAKSYFKICRDGPVFPLREVILCLKG